MKPAKSMAELDQVLSVTSNGKLVYSPVIAFPAKVPSRVTEFVTTETQDGNTLTLTLLTSFSATLPQSQFLHYRLNQEIMFTP